MNDWSAVRGYLTECDNFATEKMEDTSNIRPLDESVTRGINGLREVYGMDLDNEDVVYALVVGFCIAYRYGCTTAIGETTDPNGAQAYLRRHGPISGHIGLVARTLVQNLGITLPAPDADTE